MPLIKCECVCCLNNTAKTYQYDFGTCRLAVITITVPKEESEDIFSACKDFEWDDDKPVK